ncbi:MULTISPECIES: SRPBCC family protein [Roseobacteraceae]|uniref:ArsR family transcriptional regulator n=1 Tax=Pseudosulfitobacter pseudonitzschiae TaxID=1402135 RepID=A0A221K662_9RHOB|nr:MULTISPECIES: SRPBCC family protein [Roseobacteraceae]ASM74370.1 ArsR family transcriptional regulator [Pseudosulfitobacter pseudonitzschiae]
MTDKSASFVYVTFIRTTPEKVFEAITRPEMARRYWGHENVSDDWQPGSKWQHIRTDEARTIELVGEVIESDPPKRFVISWANESQKDDPDQYSRVTFDIEPQGDVVKLTVAHDELQPGSGMLNGISKGWPHVLSSMKSFLETGQGFDL